MLKNKCVVLGVTGSIAAYKIASLASALKKQHCDVQVIMTRNAAQFITPMTFETLTGNKCLIDTFDRNFTFEVEHISVAKKADLVLVAPGFRQYHWKACSRHCRRYAHHHHPGLQMPEASVSGHEHCHV